MKIEKNSFVLIEYFVTNELGDIVDQSDLETPFGFVVGTDHMPQGVEKRLLGQEEGAHLQFTLEPHEAYGFVKPELVRPMSRKSLPPDLDIRTGEQYQARSSIGPVSFRVNAITDNTIVGDFNHPLAGQRLSFNVKVLQIRQSTAVEIALSLSEARRQF